MDTKTPETKSNQTIIVKRIESICHEFDARAEVVGIAIARLELAKALAECEEMKTALCNQWKRR